jgi:predicted dehydrogenase
MSTSNPFTLGIIGAGNVVSANHLPVLKAMSDVQVSWITDKDHRRANRVAQAYGITDRNLEGGFDDFPKTDAVLLAIPFGVREPYYSVLAERGDAVYVEKPFARTVGDHRRLCASFADYQLACGLNRRAWGIVQFCRRIIDTRLFGKIRHVRFGFGSAGGITAGGLYTADPAIAGGGMLFETGVHGIDTILYCLDAQSARLTSGKLIMDRGHDIHCEAIVSIENPDGDWIPFEIEVSRLKNTIERVELHFDNCMATFGLFGSPELRVQSTNGKLQSVLTDRTNLYPFTWNQTLGEFWKAFLGGLEAHQANYTSANQSILTTDFVEQLYGLAAHS